MFEDDGYEWTWDVGGILFLIGMGLIGAVLMGLLWLS